MANENTPLRGGRATVDQAQHKKRLAVILGVIAAAAVALGVWVYHTRGTASSTASTPASAESSGTSDPLEGVDPSKFICGDANGQETGYIKLANKKDDHYFYWFHASRSKPETDPLVMWLTGGPGASSMMALLAENGPCTIKPDLTTAPNPYAWNNEANVIWLDQPSNVGFSFGAPVDSDKDETDVQDNIYWFLHGFLDKHPEFEGRDFYITGESYAGHYVPSAAHKIWQENKAVKAANATIRINLKGIAIGNGLTNSPVQFVHNIDMVENTYNITLMGDADYNAAKALVPKCLTLIEEVASSPIEDVAAATEKLEPCQVLMNSPAIAAKRNPYDIRQACDPSTGPPGCYDFSHIEKYLNSPTIQKYLNISTDHSQWVEGNMDVGVAFMASGDVFRNYESYVADLLNDGEIRVLLYVGDADTMCNWSGNKAWATALEWEHKIEFNAAEERPFLAAKGSVNAGVVKAYKDQFTLLRIYNSGHMVPMDQPVIALEILTKFLKNEAY